MTGFQVGDEVFGTSKGSFAERRRWPQYDHVAVIVAEEITARFFTVISLFNGFIPIIAIQMSAIELGDAVTLVFSAVLGRISWGSNRTNRNYWQSEGPRRHWRSLTTC